MLASGSDITRTPAGSGSRFRRRERTGVVSDSSSLAVVQQGFDAWRRGDFDALEAIFAPDVEWRWFEPGDWDCHSRDDVMRTLRQRHAAGFAEGRVELSRRGMRRGCRYRTPKRDRQSRMAG